jgi:hypothetical protein
MSMSKRPIPAAIAAMLAKYELAIPPTGRFKASRLDTVLRNKGMSGGRREFLMWELREAGLLDE